MQTLSFIAFGSYSLVEHIKRLKPSVFTYSAMKKILVLFLVTLAVHFMFNEHVEAELSAVPVINTTTEGAGAENMKTNMPASSSLSTPVVPEVFSVLDIDSPEKVKGSDKTAEPQSKDIKDPTVPVGMPQRIAVLPFDNFSDSGDALSKVMYALKKRVESKGVSIAPESSVNAFLCDERVRSVGYIPGGMMRKLADKFKVQAILSGSIVAYSDKEHPVVGVVSRLVNSSTGAIVWADYVSVSGDEFGSILGLNRVKDIDKLIDIAMERLFSSFEITPTKSVAGPVYKIAVLPLQNKSKSSNAGMISMYMFLVELLKNNAFEPIEYGEVRKQIIELRIRNKGMLDYENLEALSGLLGIDGVLIGTVEQYSSDLNMPSPPGVAITARLLDVSSRKVVWYNSHQMSSAKTVFDWGRSVFIDRIAHNVVLDLVKDLENVNLNR